MAPATPGIELPLRAALAAVGLCVLFGANTVAVKITLAGMGIFTTAALRFAVAAAALALWARITGQAFAVAPASRSALLVISLSFTVQLTLFYLGLSRAPASRAVLMANMQPFFLLLLAHRFIPGERITGRKVVGLALGFAGVFCMAAPWQSAAAGARGGEAFVLGAAFVWACNGILIKRVLANISAFQVVFYPMLVAVPVSAALGAVFDAPAAVRIDWPVAAGLVYQSLVVAAFGFVAWNRLLQTYGAVNLHVFIFVMPISGVLLGGLILAEPLTLNLIAALALIVAGIICINHHQKPPVPAVPLSRNI